MYVDLPDDVDQRIAVLRGSRRDLAGWKPEVDLLFFDAAGEAWWRTPAGVLKNRAGRGSASERWEEHPEGTTVTPAGESDSGTGE
jgi:hypothetical protein